MKKLLLCIPTAMVLLMISGCSIFLIDSEERKIRVNYMSLETLFPDESARALARAAGKGKVRTVEALVNSGVDVNASGTQRVTPLFWAGIRKRNHKGFKKLLELGADPNIDYIWVDSEGNPRVIGNIETIMHSVAEMKDPRFLEAALQHGGDPNIVDNKDDYETPIFRIILLWGTIGTSKDKDMEKIDILLDAGANINAQNVYGMTPVMDAFRSAEMDLTVYLLERGADYNTIKDLAGLTLVNRVANYAGRYTPKGELERLKVVEWLESRGVVMEKKAPHLLRPIEQP